VAVLVVHLAIRVGIAGSECLLRSILNCPKEHIFSNNGRVALRQVFEVDGSPARSLDARPQHAG
jgi:hypothetical protein